jgi:hypothetical protein
MKKENLIMCFFIVAVVLTDCRQSLAQSKAQAAGTKAAAEVATPAGAAAYVSGYISDSEFKVSKAFYNSRSLTLRSRGMPTGTIVAAEAPLSIKINFENNQQFEGKSYKVLVDQDKMIEGDELKPRPTLDLCAFFGAKKDRYLDTLQNHARYRMTLNFYKRQNGLLPGFIDLEIQDPHITRLKGYFWAAPQ